jgi:vanillate/3-O-methylgallate O-demethylase
MLYDSMGMPFTFPLAPEFSNWRDEQDAWRTTAIFQDMSFHMCSMLLEGRDVYRLLSDLGINSFASFGPMQAKQYVVCNSDGLYVGDAILTCEEENKVRLVGKPNVPNWVRFHLETGNYDAKVVSFDKPSPNLADRELFRFQVQGPNAQKIIEEANGGSLADIRFFKMGCFSVGPHQVTALNHRMSGAPGFEFWGPSSLGPEIKSRILEIGSKYGIRPVGGKVYPVTATESGWLSSVVPAIYTGKSTEPYRAWLPGESYESTASIGGSFPTGDLNETYLTPFDMGYGFMVKFDHEFCGRTALERMAKGPHREKVRLVWNSEDATAVQSSMYGSGPHSKYLDMPVANYSTFQMDEVSVDGKRVGMAFHPVYSASARAWISLAVVDAAVANEGRQLTVKWGEADGGSKKPTVERHAQRAVRALIETKAVRRD